MILPTRATLVARRLVLPAARLIVTSGAIALGRDPPDRSDTRNRALFGADTRRQSCEDFVLRALPLFEVYSTASERVDLAPSSGDVEQLELTDRGGERRVDDQVLADWLESQHRAQ